MHCAPAAGLGLTPVSMAIGATVTNLPLMEEYVVRKVTKKSQQDEMTFHSDPLTPTPHVRHHFSETHFFLEGGLSVSV